MVNSTDYKKGSYSSLSWNINRGLQNWSEAGRYYFRREHGTISISKFLDASGRLCRICISICFGFLPLVSGNKESGTGCVFGSGSGNDIFESSYFDFYFYWTYIFLVENYCSSGYGCDVYTDSIDLFLQVSLASGAPVLVSWPFQQQYLF